MGENQVIKPEDVAEVTSEEPRSYQVSPKLMGVSLKIGILVTDGFVYEHDVDEGGNTIGKLRPHYKPGEDGYPEGGYPDNT